MIEKEVVTLRRRIVHCGDRTSVFRQGRSVVYVLRNVLSFAASEPRQLLLDTQVLPEARCNNFLLRIARPSRVSAKHERTPDVPQTGVQILHGPFGRQIAHKRARMRLSPDWWENEKHGLQLNNPSIGQFRTLFPIAMNTS